MRHFSSGNWAFFGFLISVAALAAALFFQLSKEWFPCPLCIVQRYAFLVTAVGCLGISLTRRKSLFSSLLVLLTMAGLLIGAAVAFYHVWVLSNPMQTCGVDPLQNTLNALPWARHWPDMFMADGLCTDEYPPLLGLSLPMWSGIGFLFQGLVLLIVVRTRR